MVYAEFENGVYMGYSTLQYEVDDPNIEIREITEQEAEQFENQRTELLHLRLMRENDCFSVVNRGELWYERLTDSQKKELNDWYQKWLDITETKVKPQKPSWLK